MSQIRVRMYRPGGIGDCFLLSFQNGKGPHMLIDCGILKGSSGGKEGLKKAIQNVEAETGGELDILVVTHEHWDHVSGFVQAEEEFQRLKIKEVWLAWTEERGNPLADRLRSQKNAAKQALAASSLRLRGLLGSNAQAGGLLSALEALGLFYTDQDQASLSISALASAITSAEAGGLPLTPDGAAASDETAARAEAPAVKSTAAELTAAASAPKEDSPVAYTTSGAMDWVRLKTGGRVRYLSPETEAISIPGARVFVLGPPQDEALIKKDSPNKKNPEVYSLASGVNLGFMAVMGAGRNEADVRPFHTSFELSPEKAMNEVFFEQNYFAATQQSRRIDLDWLWTAERLALQLDSDTNNTSLVLAIEDEDSGKVLLFPGDAQVGNWLSWQTLECRAKNARGEVEAVKAEDLLKRTVLYKVGHHASHNATLRWGLELMAGENMAALIPVYEDQARKQGKKGWDMPFEPLLTRLKEKTAGRIFRTDLGAPEGWQAKSEGKYEVQEGWIDVWVGERE